MSPDTPADSGHRLEARGLRKTYRGRAVTVTAEADIWADGEPVAPAPVTIEAVPGALLLAGVTLTS